MKTQTVCRYCLLAAIVLPSMMISMVQPLVISSVYAGKKKFKTYSFDTPLLPAIVKVQPNKFHLTFRQNKYLRTPQFKIEGTIPLKAPTVVKEKPVKDPNPVVNEYNFGQMDALREPLYSSASSSSSATASHQSYEPLRPPSPPRRESRQPSVVAVPMLQKKINIGEHYMPSGSHDSPTYVEKPTYDPDEAAAGGGDGDTSEPDEGSISFSFSGPHGGDEVPAGYEQRIKDMHEELKNHPHHLPPGLDVSQIHKYYTAYSFTDPLMTNYGYKAAYGPLAVLKSKLKSWTKFI